MLDEPFWCSQSLDKAHTSQPPQVEQNLRSRTAMPQTRLATEQKKALRKPCIENRQTLEALGGSHNDFKLIEI